MVIDNYREVKHPLIFPNSIMTRLIWLLLQKVEYIIYGVRDCSLITGRRVLQNWGGGASEVLLLRKGGTEKVLPC